jgi:hypothetical protein
MHAELPAVRMLLFARDGDWASALHALHDCQRYPFVWPVCLALVQAFTGVSEIACRMAGRWIWAIGLFGLFLVARELVARLWEARGRAGRGDELVPWLALVMAAASPLALSFSGTLFLEMPFVVVSIFALRAWLRRGRGRVELRELAAGAWLALALFTKFNYGLLLGFGLTLALIVEAVLEARAGRLRGLLARDAWLALIPALGAVWWFLLPLPEGLEMGRAHREALVAFLTGNLDPSMWTDPRLLPIHATCFLVWAPRVLAVMLLGAAATLAWIRARPIWTLWLAWVASTLPVLLHPFHDDRFLLPGAVFLWVLAALGIARALPRNGKLRAGALAALALALTVFPDVDAMLMLRWTGLANPDQHAYQQEMLASFRDLRAGRRLETNGFARAEVEALLDLLEAEVQPTDHVAWIGMTQNFSPAAMHVGLVARGAGAPEEIRSGLLDASFIDLGYVDPNWSDERLLAWAAAYTLILTTNPIDMAGNPNRAFMARYRDALRASHRFEERPLGTVTIHRPRGEIAVELFALRPRR